MKHKIKNMTKKIVAFALCMATIMSLGLTDTITAEAANVKLTKVETNDGASVYRVDGNAKGNIVVTLKPGQAKELIVGGVDWKGTKKNNIVHAYKWVAEDKNIVTVYEDFTYSDELPIQETLELIGANVGTTTIVGHDREHLTDDITITVKVAFPKATAKQKKCKHKYKITQKATCVASGVKTCTKCKFQKATGTSEHEWIVSTQKELTGHVVFECTGDTHEDGCSKGVDCDRGPACTKACTFRAREVDYGSKSAAYAAWGQHAKEMQEKGYAHHFTYADNLDYTTTEMVRVRTCDNCGKCEELETIKGSQNLNEKADKEAEKNTWICCDDCDWSVCVGDYESKEAAIGAFTDHAMEKSVEVIGLGISNYHNNYHEVTK